jgi:ATP-binding cassette, subfamily B (MDR/TAP), member 1
MMFLSRITTPIIAIVKAAAAATEIFTTIDASVPNTSGLKAPEISGDLDISFDNVSFSYPSRPNVQILDGFSGQFKAGKVTAIVGPSGAGKRYVTSSSSQKIEINY